MKQEALISKMRRENKQKRIELAKTKKADEKVIRSVFHQSKEQLLSLQRFTAEKCIEVMDQKVCEASKRLSNLQHDRNVREERLKSLEHELSRMRIINSTDYDEVREQKIRRIQNEMDKACIKDAAARNITRRYQAIMDHLQHEVRNYPTVLDDLEEKFKISTDELKELKAMSVKAIKSSEEARNDLHTMEKEMYQAKRSRDQQLNETRKDVERRKESVDKAHEKRPRVNLLSESSDSRQAKLAGQKAERQEKILTLEDAFEKIKKAIHVSDMEDILYRLENQGLTYIQLKKMEKEKAMKKNKYSEELSKLRVVFEELKFTSERQMQKGRKVLEDMAEYMQAEENARNTAVDLEESNEKLLINIQTGIATLFEKLKDVRLKPPYHNFAKGHPVEDLIQCGRKLDLLLSTLGLKRDQPVAVMQRVDSEKLHKYLETQQPNDNIRIRIDVDDHSDTDEFHFDHDQDNEGFTSREDIKRQGQEILNSKLKPKKKKRKRNA